MRVAMFGYQTWGHRTLQALIDAGHEVALVVTHPKSDHAYERIWADSVADLAEAHGIRVLLRNRPDARGCRRRSSSCRATAPSTSTTRCCRRTRAFRR
jgi:methionyl-tRNA formyltransferase